MIFKNQDIGLKKVQDDSELFLADDSANFSLVVDGVSSSKGDVQRNIENFNNSVAYAFRFDINSKINTIHSSKSKDGFDFIVLDKLKNIEVFETKVTNHEKRLFPLILNTPPNLLSFRTEDLMEFLKVFINMSIQNYFKKNFFKGKWKDKVKVFWEVAKMICKINKNVFEFEIKEHKDLETLEIEKIYWKVRKIDFRVFLGIIYKIFNLDYNKSFFKIFFNENASYFYNFFQIWNDEKGQNQHRNFVEFYSKSLDNWKDIWRDILLRLDDKNQNIIFLDYAHFVFSCVYQPLNDPNESIYIAQNGDIQTFLIYKKKLVKISKNFVNVNLETINNYGYKRVMKEKEELLGSIHGVSSFISDGQKNVDYIDEIHYRKVNGEKVLGLLNFTDGIFNNYWYSTTLESLFCHIKIVNPIKDGSLFNWLCNKMNSLKNKRTKRIKKQFKKSWQFWKDESNLDTLTLYHHNEETKFEFIKESNDWFFIESLNKKVSEEDRFFTEEEILEIKGRFLNYFIKSEMYDNFTYHIFMKKNK